MDDDDIVGKAKRNAITLGIVATSLGDFVSAVIGHASRGGVLDDAALTRLREACIRDMKNSELTGASIEDEAAIFRQAIELLRHLIDGAIAHSRER